MSYIQAILMPHNRLQFMGGVVINETPVINQSSIAVSNRIRFKPDAQGLTLPEKLGGWARFLATAITNGIVRALWGWQDTNSNQWLAYGTDNATAAQLGVVQCTVDPTTGLTTATGTVMNITPSLMTVSVATDVWATVGDSLYQVTDPNLVGFLPNTFSAYFTTPVSVGGVVLQSMYATQPYAPQPTLRYNIVGTDILGNPLVSTFSTQTTGGLVVTHVAFSLGSPSTLTFTYTGGPYIFPVGSAITVTGLVPASANGTYVSFSSATGTFSATTLLTAYTYASGGVAINTGAVPQFAVTAGSNVITVTFVGHGFSVGDTFEILNETLVGGITLFGSYQVQTVTNAYTFTINSSTSATVTSEQYQNAFTITGGAGNGTDVTLNYSSAAYTKPFTFGQFINVAGIVSPSAWNGHYPVVSATAGSVTFANTTAGAWGSGGSVADEGGDIGIIYSFSSTAGQTDPGVAVSADFWSLDNWGNDLLALPVPSSGIDYPAGSVPFQPIYYWDPTAGQAKATAISNGPTAANGMFVAMPQRQIIAWGCAGPDPGDGIIDPLLVRWCDVNDFTDWVAQVTNQAGSFRLSSGSIIRGGRQVPQQGLLWTDIDLWAMQYIGQPLVYGFNKIGQGCGLIARNAHAVLGGVVYWMSENQFFALSGTGVQAIPCPVWDVVFQDLDLANVDKIVAAANSLFQEVAWYYPVKGGNGEPSAYVKLNTQLGVWDYGTLGRSAWIDQSVLQQPIGADPVSGFIYQHEISPDADGAAMGETFTTGWFALAEGDVMPYVDQFWPDFKWGYYGQSQNANVVMTFAAQAYPGTDLYSYGPYTINEATSYISPRIRSRLISFTVSGTGTGTWWRLGGLRYRYAPDGKY